MEMEMENYLKDSNVSVGVVVGVDLVTPTDTANHELAAAQVAVDVGIKCPFLPRLLNPSKRWCYITLLAMPSESEPSESGSEGESTTVIHPSIKLSYLSS